ncbi:MAG: hypothetical protein RR324_01255 [Cellulosilyticaceae bacterium]
MRKLKRSVLAHKMYAQGIKHKHFRTLWLKQEGKQAILDREAEARAKVRKMEDDRLKAKAAKKKAKEKKEKGSLGARIGKAFKIDNKSKEVLGGAQ